VTVGYATADGTATAGTDYQSASGPLTFAPGETNKPVNVTVNPDAPAEGMETFAVDLSGAVGAGIGRGTAGGRILDPPAGGDFNADDRADLIWRHDVSGQNVIWSMNGATLLGGTFTTPPSLTDVRWKMVGTNDFNADGRPDILWRHSASGEIVVWLMNGSVLQSGTFLTPPAFTDVNWQTVGTGDFNSDGKTDILWRHAVSGQNVVWFLEGTSLTSGAFTNPPALVDVSWRMVATADYNNDGKVDIVWRHSTSGQNALWFMDGINLIGGALTNTLADNNWKIVGPR
jgi:hypothetical protein